MPLVALPLLVGTGYLNTRQAGEIKAASDNRIQAKSEVVKEAEAKENNKQQVVPLKEEKQITGEVPTKEKSLAEKTKEQLMKLDVSGSIIEGLQGGVEDLKKDNGEVISLKSDEMNLLIDYTIKNEEGEVFKCNFSLERSAERLPAYETKEKAVEFFKARHKAMTLLEVYPHDDDYLDKHPEESKEAFYMIWEGDKVYAYCNDGEYGLIMAETLNSDEGSFSNFERCVMWYSKYSWISPVLSWNADGTFIKKNFRDKEYAMYLDIGTGNRLFIECELVGMRETESIDYTYSVEVSEDGNKTPLQLFEVDTMETDPFYFEDMNMDGYQDFIVDYHRAHNTSRTVYLWNSAQKKFVRFKGELFVFSQSNRTNPEKREVIQTIHNSGVDKEYIRYRWINETDYQKLSELRVYLVYEEGPDYGWHYTITFYDKQGNVSGESNYFYGENISDEKEAEIYDEFLKDDIEEK